MSHSDTACLQGINGGTARDLAERGYSPWGHLDPSKPQSNITFAQTLARDRPDIVAVQIGINDFMHVDPFASNASEYYNVLLHEIVGVVRQMLPGSALYLASISVDGEEVNNSNHKLIAPYAQAALAVGQATGVPVVDLWTRYIEYETANNCLNVHGGLLTGAGVHPYTPQGKAMLANAHAEGILRALNASFVTPNSV